MSLRTALSREENGLYGQEEQHEEVEEAREGKTRTLPKGLTAEQIRVPHTFVKELMMMEEYQQYVSILLLERSSWWRSVPVMVGRENRTKMMIAHVVPFKGGGVDWLVVNCFVT